ncbi:MAG: lyase family protein [Paracoccus sp. (in: a-proteobacteria)]|nr:lyase family protein [Paracoccus sp. (in: a-proteobacteria)]
MSGLYAQLFGDAETRAVMGDQAHIAAMLRVEQALAAAEADLGIIPQEAAQTIAALDLAAVARAASVPQTDLACGLAGGTAQAGIAAQPFVAALKKAAGDAGPWVHFGATSQDITDSALALQYRDLCDLLAERLSRLEAALAEKARDYAGQPIPARTRQQIAAPTTLGAKIAVWRAPLMRHLDRLAELRPRLLTVSLYGAAGTGAALQGRMGEVRAGMARALGLHDAAMPHHATRDMVAELGGLLSLISGSLGKIGADLIALGQSEIGEVMAGAGGGSSTMPQKANPVAAEALVTLARMNAGALANLHHALIHAQERDGAALGLEWLTLPEMAERTGAALRIAQELAESLRPAPARIKATFAADRGRMMAEAAGFALAETLPRAEALRIVAAALNDVQSGAAPDLASALAGRAPGTDWATRLAPENTTGDAESIARNITNSEETP